MTSNKEQTIQTCSICGRARKLVGRIGYGAPTPDYDISGYWVYSDLPVSGGCTGTRHRWR